MTSAPAAPAMRRQYICDACYGTFTTEWTDEDAMAESRRLFGNLPVEELSRVCEDCFHKLKVRVQ